MKTKVKKLSKHSPATKTGGYSYSVTDEELAHFASLAPIDRLKWVDDTRKFILMAETDKTQDIREKLRKGELLG